MLEVIDEIDRASPAEVDRGIGVAEVILDGRTGADEYDVPADSDTVICNVAVLDVEPEVPAIVTV